MTGNASTRNELGQCVELVGAVAKAMAFIAPKMTPQARQSWIGMPPRECARVLEALVFLPANHNPANLIIDCDADPFVPDGWQVKEHMQGGQLVFDPYKVEFYLSDGQKGGQYIEGNMLRKELAKKPVLNANVLDYLLKNPHLIPEEWKEDGQGNTRYIFFWGTIYRDRDGSLCVRYLDWGDDRWYWGGRWLSRDWCGSDPSALRAS